MAAATHAKSAAGWCRSPLQGHQLEIALIVCSGLRLCLAAAAAGYRWLACCLALVHLLSLFIEFGNKQALVSPYSLRRSESHGLAQGVLALPSVLAALAAVARHQGNWDIWALASCAAAFVVLLTVLVQSRSTAATAAAAAEGAAATNGEAAGKRMHVLKNSQHNQGCEGFKPPLQAQKQQQQQPQACMQTSCWQPVIKVLPAACCAVIAAAAAWLAAAQHASVQAPFQEHLQEQLSIVGAQPAPPSPALLAAAACTTVLAPALYCLFMQLLPSCFSIGEGALMAQGAAGLAAAAALVLPQAPLFVPDAVCQLLPAAGLQLVFKAGGCSSTAHSRALSSEALPAAILLVVASTLLLCLLLRALLGVLGCCSSSSSRNTSAACQETKTATISSSSRLCSVLLAVPIVVSMVALLLFLVCAAAWTVLEFVPARQGRLLVLLYWVGLLGVMLPALALWANHSKVPQIIVRKVYHLLAGGLFVPVFFWDLPMLCLSLAIAFAALQLLEVLRRLQLPRIGTAVQQFMQDFVDERDSGVIYVTHFTLLLGLAVPMWLCLGLPGVDGFVAKYSSSDSVNNMLCHSSSNSSESRGECLAPAASNADALSSRVDSGSSIEGGSGGSSASALLLVMAGLSGMVIIGVGDTAASMVGKLLGRVPIHAGSRKTVEGTVAGIASSLGAWCLLLWAVGMGVPGGMSWAWWLQLLLATAGAGLLEAVTSQLDNVLLPLWYLPHLLLVQR